jgi:hypothetical protein
VARIWRNGAAELVSGCLALEMFLLVYHFTATGAPDGSSARLSSGPL